MYWQARSGWLGAGTARDITLDVGLDVEAAALAFNIPNARSAEHDSCLQPPAPPHIPGAR
jgi:hypothetical protein